MPISLAEGWEAVEEERRLLYVGVTRARRARAPVVVPFAHAGRPRLAQALALPRRADG